MKTNISHFFHLCSVSLSSVLVLAVFLTATHAKDIMIAPSSASATPDAPAARTHDDSLAKSFSDLHSHVDKTMVKDPGMNKSFGDNATLTARREREEVDDDQPLSVKMIEMILLVKLAYAYAVS